MLLQYASALAFSIGPAAIGQIVVYEASTWPQDSGWTTEQIVCGPQLWLEGGWFYQHVDLCPGYDPPGGQFAAYRRSLADFIGAPDFFLEYRVQSDAPRTEIPWGGGAGIAMGSFGPTNYAFYIARDQAKLNRDNRLPIVFVDLDPATPHTHRLELFGADRYVWYIDGRIVDSGIPEGQYPSSEPTIVWVARAAWGPSTQRWDYIRYGRIPPIVPGDLNCDGAINNLDIDPFVQALADPNGYSAEHAACNRLNADTNHDGLVNNFDIDPFVALLVGG